MGREPIGDFGAQPAQVRRRRSALNVGGSGVCDEERMPAVHGRSQLLGGPGRDGDVDGVDPAQSDKISVFKRFPHAQIAKYLAGRGG